jgi:hypothetical protein
MRPCGLRWIDLRPFQIQNGLRAARCRNAQQHVQPGVGGSAGLEKLLELLGCKPPATRSGFTDVINSDYRPQPDVMNRGAQN